jgi:uncharacterized protein
MTARTPSSRRPSTTRAKSSSSAAGARSSAGPPPRIAVMRSADCLALLERHTVGRIAYAHRNRVDIVPIHYVHSDGWLFARTSDGAKMTTLRHVPWVAFEVDEVDGVFDWKSVVVHGTVYRMAPDGAPAEAKLWSKGMALLKRIVPETGTPDDPVPFRTVVFGIHVDTITGRSSSRARTPPRARPR